MPSKADNTKQMIVEKAAPLFNTKGYAGTSMRDILAATGLTKGGVYGNFPGKDEIAAAAFAHSYGKLRAALLRAVASQATAQGRLVAVLKFYRNYTVQPVVAGGCPVMNAAVETDDAYPVLHRQVRAALAELLAGLSRLFAQGITEEALRPDLNPDQEAEYFYAQIQGGILLSQTSGDPRVLNRLLDRLRDYLERQLVR
ncbi:TetR/AcrR family transcriptional regulator [Hymenobacter weizhouensis]|uniref:TetR/AcrR family transcriptional regulator n=1 Tax=Hymenobacter sp. YIM 151500-1 TaxID=2987689 RepID=UPI00222802CC|nr:TetR/AcrR family transcriptional regulator [Hymenobacter sp. YIM 151500-1]UYZ62274.1 TetR/AcrR family transcriptional regulator [Hymenobacter sp. YIM 151500-1]